MIFDFTGKKTLEKKVDGQKEVAIDIGFLPSGSYTVICDGEFRQSIVIAK
jgi:hypothetical protein